MEGKLDALSFHMRHIADMEERHFMTLRAWGSSGVPWRQLPGRPRYPGLAPSSTFNTRKTNEGAGGQEMSHQTFRCERRRGKVAARVKGSL